MLRSASSMQGLLGSDGTGVEDGGLRSEVGVEGHGDVAHQEPAARRDLDAVAGQIDQAVGGQRVVRVGRAQERLDR